MSLNPLLSKPLPAQYTSPVASARFQQTSLLFGKESALAFKKPDTLELSTTKPKRSILKDTSLGALGGGLISLFNKNFSRPTLLLMGAALGLLFNLFSRLVSNPKPSQPRLEIVEPDTYQALPYWGNSYDPWPPTTQVIHYNTPIFYTPRRQGPSVPRITQRPPFRPRPFPTHSTTTTPIPVKVEVISSRPNSSSQPAKASEIIDAEIISEGSPTRLKALPSRASSASRIKIQPNLPKLSRVNSHSVMKQATRGGTRSYKSSGGSSSSHTSVSRSIGRASVSRSSVSRGSSSGSVGRASSSSARGK